MTSLHSFTFIITLTVRGSDTNAVDHDENMALHATVKNDAVHLLLNSDSICT